MMKLGDFSPAYGVITGRGTFGDSPLAKLIHGDKDDEEKQKNAAEAQAAPAYKKGGSVRGAGCAIKGVKKCKMR